MIQMILISVGISSVAQMLLKLGMSSSAVQAALTNGSFVSIALAIGLNAYVLLGLGLYFFGAVLWLFVLARIDLSLAYPFVALGFVLTSALGIIVLREQFSLYKLAGTSLILAGVFTLSRGV